MSWSAATAQPVTIDLGGGTSLELVPIRAGEFTQGSPADEAGRGGDELQRKVRITRDFLIGRSAVTRGQWERFVAETGYRSEAEIGTSGGFGWDGAAMVQKKQFTWRNPGFSQTNDHPVCMVTFPDAQAFCKWLERKSRRKTTLPTEAQWEYACRAGSNTPWHGGTSAEGHAWHKGNSGNSTHPVDSNPANAWGLFIGGNISEWCLDWYAPYPDGPVIDPLQENPNLSDKPRRVLRGGSWIRDAKNSRSAARYRVDPRSRNADVGFRVVCAAEVPVPPVPLPAAVPAAPRVEAEPGYVPPRPADPPVEVPAAPTNWNPPDHASGGGVKWSGLLCLLVPVGLIIMFVRLIAGHGKSRPNTFVPPLDPPLEPPVQRQLIRKVGDGFWLNGNWPAGTPLKLSYMVGGAAHDLELIYQPGPEGQFIHTGLPPESVSVVSDGGNPTPLLSSLPPVFPDREEERQRGVSRPPVSPSAY